MSLHLDFDPHSWYMGFTIKHDSEYNDPCEWSYTPDSKHCVVHDFKVHPSDKYCEGFAPKWAGYTENGNFYFVDTLTAESLGDLKRQIREYHLCKFNGYGERIARRRLEYLRGELRAERISYGELAELFKLHEYIDKEDVELREAAGIPENQ